MATYQDKHPASSKRQDPNNPLIAEDSGVGDERVQSSEALEDMADGALDLPLVADVERDDLVLTGDLFALAWVAARNDHTRTRCRERIRDREAEAAVATRHQGHAVG